jgi:hypothetical protein
MSVGWAIGVRIGGVDEMLGLLSLEQLISLVSCM